MAPDESRREAETSWGRQSSRGISLLLSSPFCCADFPGLVRFIFGLRSLFRHLLLSSFFVRHSLTWDPFIFQADRTLSRSKMQSMQRKFGRMTTKQSADDSQVAVLLKDFEDADMLLAKVGSIILMTRVPQWFNSLSPGHRFHQGLARCLGVHCDLSEPPGRRV